MDLERKFLLCIEQFDQKREPRRVRNGPENTDSMLAPKLVQRCAFERTIGNNTLRFRSIDNFPRLTDSFVRWHILAEELREFAAAPNSFHENGLEDQGIPSRSGSCCSGHRSEIRFQKVG